MPNAWRAKLPCEFHCIQPVKVVWDKMYRIEPNSADMVTTFLVLNPYAILCQKEQYAFLLAPYLASLAQQIPFYFSPEASTVDVTTCAIQALQKHFTFTG